MVTPNSINCNGAEKYAGFYVYASSQELNMKKLLIIAAFVVSLSGCIGWGHQGDADHREGQRQDQHDDQHDDRQYQR